MNSETDFSELVARFRFEGVFERAEPISFGHINDTYAAYFRAADGSAHRYIMQRINHHVFKDVAKLMSNISSVTQHIRGKIMEAGGDPNRETLTLVLTLEGQFHLQLDSGDYWRAHLFIKDARTWQTPESPRHVYNAARAFGRFQNFLADFPIDRLHETIPDFHNTAKRFETFLKALEKDPHNRAGDAGDEIDFLLQRADEVPVLVDLIDQGHLPVRVTHNDTKFNNVMIDDNSGEGICVIDLDTVMPGSSLYDFGDAIRSITNTAEEDERDLGKVRFCLRTFEEYTRGCLESTRDILQPLEIQHMAFSARLMTMECGMRFLTDHLDGDAYFRTARENHNLDRSRTQFKLVQDMEENYNSMLRIIQNHALA